MNGQDEEFQTSGEDSLPPDVPATEVPATEVPSFRPLARIHSLLTLATKFLLRLKMGRFRPLARIHSLLT